MTACSQLHERLVLPGHGGGHCAELKQQNSRLVCTRDPEMERRRSVYHRGDLLSVYIEKCKFADIITPN